MVTVVNRAFIWTGYQDSQNMLKELCWYVASEMILQRSVSNSDRSRNGENASTCTHVMKLNLLLLKYVKIIIMEGIRDYVFWWWRSTLKSL